MLYYALVFFIIAVIAAAFGFGGIAAGAASYRKDTVLYLSRRLPRYGGHGFNKTLRRAFDPFPDRSCCSGRAMTGALGRRDGSRIARFINRGDIDTHGFGISDPLRGRFAHAESVPDEPRDADGARSVLGGKEAIRSRATWRGARSTNGRPTTTRTIRRGLRLERERIRVGESCCGSIPRALHPAPFFEIL
jgi:Protein of unknown function (DUF1328)